MKWTQGEYTITDRRQDLDIATIHGFLSKSYWARGIPKQIVEKAVNNSLCFGLYHESKQIGYGDIMKIPRLTVLTLGVSDLIEATRFYEKVLNIAPNTTYDGITFFELAGTWISLYPREDLAKDIASDLAPGCSGFNGITLAHNARRKDDVLAIIERAASAGARVVKQPQETFWGGFSGYFADPDGYFWEVVWGPMFDFTENGELRFKDSA